MKISYSIVIGIALLTIMAMTGVAEAQTSGSSVVLPSGTYYYTPTMIYHQGSGIFIPAGSYYNPDNGAYFQGASLPADSSDTGGSAGGTTNGSVTPGAPDTGAGGNAIAAMFVLFVSAFMAAGALGYMNRYRSLP